NFYAQYYSIHEDDQVIVEVLKGADAQNMAVVMQWQMAVKDLTGEKGIDLENEKLKDASLKSVSLKYVVN
ncbi:MAG: hypothetical protein H7Y04_02360, partial [Verrucomicrobia bacterium]|nr:hypothetical protein [Cytophagales bacterium]